MWMCMCTVSSSASLPAARHQPNPVSSTLITWFLYNRLAGRNESLCLPQEMPSCSDSSLIQQHYRELHTLRFISIQITRTIRATERAAHSQWEQWFLELRSASGMQSGFHSTVRELQESVQYNTNYGFISDCRDKLIHLIQFLLNQIWFMAGLFYGTALACTDVPNIENK